jgi:hypothetical protein
LVLKQPLGKSGQMPAFSLKSKEAIPKTEVLEQPQVPFISSLKAFRAQRNWEVEKRKRTCQAKGPPLFIR